MDNERNDLPQEGWLDDILGAPTPESELGPDEHAVASAGLIHPDDMELEQILAEHRQEEEAAQEAVIAAIDEAIAAGDALPSETEEIPSPAAEEMLPDEPTQFFTPQEAFLPEEETVISPALAEESEEELPEEEALPEENALPEAKQQPRKSRPKRKKGYGLLGIPHILSTLIWLAIILVIGVSLGRTLWLCCADLMAFGKTPMEASITITEEDDITTVSEKLGEAGLVRYPGLFKTFAELTGKAENISTGTFTLDAKLDYNAMINGMTYYGPSREEIDVTFPEGYTCAQIFALLEENNVCTVAELEEYAANGELGDYWFLEGVERGDKYCLEGYLFPDTYTFYTNDEPERVLEKFLDCFDLRFTDIMRERLVEINAQFAEMLSDEGFGQEYIDSHQITIHEVVIIASLIEKESAGVDESYTISSVIYNRLSDSSQPPYLNFDSALVYALGKSELTGSDMATDTPYNLYLYTGLPPTAISNPGLDSLDAALVPEDTDYLYFALNPETGFHKFFTNYSDHQAFLDTLDDD